MRLPVDTAPEGAQRLVPLGSSGQSKETAIPRTARKRFCAKPFEYLEVIPDGRAYVCCSGWLPTSVGNVQEQPVLDLWNSEMARAIRESILDDSFRFCTRCPYLRDVAGDVQYADALSNPEHASLYARRATQVPRISWLNLAYDKTCNLSCPSCRTRLIVADAAEHRRLTVLQDRLLAGDLLSRIDWLYVTGSGDPFASRLFRDLLRSLDPARYPELRIKLHTNGLLLTPGEWQALGAARSMVKELELSVDAAKPATYALNRRGGTWERLLESLALAGELRRSGALAAWQLSFVVQANNWREMPDFVALAARFGADHVYFSGLSHWYTFSAEEYRQRAVHRPDHPEHDLFALSLRDARLHPPTPRVTLAGLAPAG